MVDDRHLFNKICSVLSTYDCLSAYRAEGYESEVSEEFFKALVGHKELLQLRTWTTSQRQRKHPKMFDWLEVMGVTFYIPSSEWKMYQHLKAKYE